MIGSQTSSHRRNANHAAIAWVAAVVVFLGTQIVGGAADLVADAGLAMSGLLIMLGMVLTWHQWGRGIVSVVAPLLLLVAGSGYVVAGLTPESDSLTSPTAGTRHR